MPPGGGFGRGYGITQARRKAVGARIFIDKVSDRFRNVLAFDVGAGLDFEGDSF